MNKKLRTSLVDIFCHVADAVDGGEKVPKHIKDAYLAAMEVPEVQKFYEDLVDDNPMNAWL